MRSVKMKGRSVEDATKAALQVLGVKKEDVEVKVITEGGGGVLGIGGKEAEVEVIETGDISEHAKGILQDIVDKMGFEALININETESEYIELEIRGEDMGRIIGRDGATLSSIQYLLGVILSKKKGEKVKVLVDAEGYKKKRELKMGRMAEEVAAEVESTGKEVRLDPMSPADRRAAHMALQDNPNVTTYSEGEGSDRRLVVAPKQGK